MLRDLDEAADARAEPRTRARGARPRRRCRRARRAAAAPRGGAGGGGAPPGGDDDANRLAKLAAEDAARGDDAEAEEGPGGGEEIDGPDDHAGEVADWSSLASGPLQEEAPRADASTAAVNERLQTWLGAQTTPEPRPSRPDGWFSGLLGTGGEERSAAAAGGDGARVVEGGLDVNVAAKMMAEEPPPPPPAEGWAARSVRRLASWRGGGGGDDDGDDDDDVAVVTGAEAGASAIAKIAAEHGLDDEGAADEEHVPWSHIAKEMAHENVELHAALDILSDEHSRALAESGDQYRGDVASPASGERPRRRDLATATTKALAGAPVKEADNVVQRALVAQRATAAKVAYAGVTAREAVKRRVHAARAYVSEEGREAHAERKERLVAVKTMAPIICDAVLLRRAELLAFRKRIAQGRSQRSRGLRFVGTPGPQPRAHSPPSVRNVAPTTDRADHDAGIADRKDRKARRARHLVQMLEVRLLKDWGWSPDHVVFQRNVENITRRQIKKAEEWSDAIDAITDDDARTELERRVAKATEYERLSHMGELEQVLYHVSLDAHGVADEEEEEEEAEEEVSVAWYLVAWFALISVLVFFVCVPPLGLLYVATEMGNAKTLVWIYQCFVGMMLFYWVVLPIEIAFFLLFIPKLVRHHLNQHSKDKSSFPYRTKLPTTPVYYLCQRHPELTDTPVGATALGQTALDDATDDEIVDQIVSVHRDTTWTPPLHMFFLMTFMGLFMMLPGDFQAMAFEELFTVASIVVHYITNHVLFGTLDLMGTGVGEDDVDGGMMEFLELLCICVILGLAYLGLSLAGCSCNGVRAAVARCCKGCERLFFGY